MIQSRYFPSIGLMTLMLIFGLYLYLLTDYEVSWGIFWAVLFFFGLIFFVATAFKGRGDNEEDSMLIGNRQIPLWIGAFTMSATWIGGGYINGTAEYTATQGLLWVQAPWGYAMSLFIGGLVFAKPMRSRGYKTLLDPLRERFGRLMEFSLFFPALGGEIFWTASILTALGTTIGVILGIDSETAIWVSAGVAIAYTAIGGLWAVALTDVVQLSLLFLGLSLVVPYAIEVVGGFDAAWNAYKLQWKGQATMIPSSSNLGNSIFLWWDYAFLLMLGGIPWQVYFQRVLSAKSTKTAVRLSYIAGIACLLASIPAILIGIVGSVAPWSALGLGGPPDAASTLPYVLLHLSNPIVTTIGLGAIAAAVMSSVDSSILSASSMGTINIVKPVRNYFGKTTDISKVLKQIIWIIGLSATLIALNIKSVYTLWFLCSDLVYCLIFPQFLLALFDPKANWIGSISAFIVGVFFRLAVGEETLGLVALFDLKEIFSTEYDIPFRTLIMLLSIVIIMVLSRLTNKIAEPMPLRKIDTGY